MTIHTWSSVLVGRIGTLLVVATIGLASCDVPSQDSAVPAQLEQAVTVTEGALPSSATHQCVLFENGPRFCFAKCRPTDAWKQVGSYPDIPFGGCSRKALDYCDTRGGLDEYCWGIKMP